MAELKQEISIIKELENESNILFAYLFGSYAKGTQNEKSDIDIAVYLIDEKILEKEPLYPSRIAIRIENRFDNKKVDMRILHGKLLHSKDEKKRIEFETSSLAQYYDFKPHIDRYDAARRARMEI